MWRDITMAIAGANLVSVAYSLVAGNYTLAVLNFIASVVCTMTARELD